MTRPPFAPDPGDFGLAKLHPPPESADLAIGHFLIQCIVMSLTLLTLLLRFMANIH